MKVRAVFFASLREAVDNDVLDLDIDDGASLDDLRRCLASRLDEDQMAAIGGADIRVAVNRRLVHDGEESVLSAGDEVAFMPPVTGG
ncbi:MAG: MoaD/ThiS family protein [Gammaproteobacteria bacterium]|nr:MoaD/ThiS family protein [Gammaproteobacteria bacterium]